MNYGYIDEQIGMGGWVNMDDTAEYDIESDAAEQDEHIEKDYEARIAALTGVITKRRTDAVNGRKNSGIEEEWDEDENFYRGIDDANRDQHAKPTNHTGGAIGVRKTSTTRSTVFINITRPYVDSAAARISDLLLPTDDRNWSIAPTPMPELMDALNDLTELETEDGTPVMQEPSLKAMMPAAMGGAPTNLPGVGDRPAEQMGVPQAQGAMQPRPKTVSDLAAEEMETARKRADAATKQIDDWQVQSQYAAEVRKVIEDCARVGTGVLKGPFPKKFKYRKAEAADGEGLMLTLVEDIAPASKRVSPWNLYPDPDCGESIHDGAYLFEMDYMTTKQIKDLAGLPGYKDEALLEVLEEGPKRKSEVTRAEVKDDDRFEVWYYYGFLDKEDMEAMGEADGEQGCALVQTPVIVTLINDHIVKCAVSPIESGEFPFDLIPWQRRRDMPWGIGVARQINTAQRMLNAAARNMMDNAGLSAGPQIVLRKGVVTPADGKWEITPRKYWFINEDADALQVQHAFMAVQIPSAQAELSQIIQFALQMAEQTTGMPMLLQGQGGQIGPAAETVGGMTLLANNASTVLRRMARTFDDCITEPHTRRYYEWLMIYGEDAEAKGDFVVDARGSSALVERDLQNQAVMQMAQLVMNPAFGINPQKWFEEACKVQRLDPKRFTFTEEEKAQMQQAAQQQPQQPMPQVEAAKVKAEADLQRAQISAQVQQMRIQKDTDRDTAYVEAQGNRDSIQAQAKMQELQMKRELAMLEYANRNQIQLTEVKARLAETGMKLQLQRELSAMSNAAKQVIEPAVEPAGRAPRGQAFER